MVIPFLLRSLELSAVTDLTRQGKTPGRVVSDKGDKTTSLNTNSNALVASEVQWKETK